MNRVSITDSLQLASDPETMLPALDEAITRLEQVDAEQARIVELRYFAGYERRGGRGRDGYFTGHLEAPMGPGARVAVPGAVAMSRRRHGFGAPGCV
jgi:hypothetical protein